MNSKNCFPLIAFALCLSVFLSNAMATPRAISGTYSKSTTKQKAFADNLAEVKDQIMASHASSSNMTISNDDRMDLMNSMSRKLSENEGGGKHYHYNYHVAYPCTNPNNLPGAPASIDATFGPYCSCSSDFDFAAHCASDQALIDGVANQPPSDDMCASLELLGLDCPDTVGEVYGCGPFVCEKTNITPQPGTC